MQRFVWLGLMVTACAGPGEVGGTDSDCVERTFYQDRDGDGFGVDPVVACEQPAGTALQPGDCDDVDADQHPGGKELCNGEDDDCDGEIHPEERDEDEDGVRFCRDCDDQDPMVLPGVAELCNGKDDDCDGTVDEPDDEGKSWFIDNDEDGFGDPDGEVLACFAPLGHVANGEDCDDGDPEIHPDAFERCDDIDHDCDGGTWGWRLSASAGIFRVSPSAGDTVCIEPGVYPSSIIASEPVRWEGVGDPDDVILERSTDFYPVLQFVRDPDPAEEREHILANLTLRAHPGDGHLLIAERESHPVNLEGVRFTAVDWACPTVQGLRGSWADVELDSFACSVGWYLPEVDADGLDVHDGAFVQQSYGSHGVELRDVQALRLQRVMVWNGSDYSMPELVRARRIADVLVEDVIVQEDEDAGYTEDNGLLLLADEIGQVRMSRLDVDVRAATGALIRADRIADFSVREADLRAVYWQGLLAPRTAGNLDIKDIDLRDVHVRAEHGTAALVDAAQLLAVRHAVLADVAFEGDFDFLLSGRSGTSVSFATWRGVTFAPSEPGGLLRSPCTIDHLDLSASDLSATHTCTTTWSNAFDVSGIELSWPSAEPRYRDATSDDASAWDLRPAADSPLVDAGDPSVKESDGSGADISAYGGR